MDSENSYSKIYAEVKKLCSLEIENARLLLTEKLTLLVAKIMLTAVVFVLSTAAMIFVSMALADFLLRTLSPAATYSIVGLFYIIVAVLIAVFRKSLIVDPVARYVSRVVLDPPECRDERREEKALEKSTSHNHKAE